LRRRVAVLAGMGAHEQERAGGDTAGVTRRGVEAADDSRRYRPRGQAANSRASPLARATSPKSAARRT
jgi:hypothetical protein